MKPDFRIVRPGHAAVDLLKLVVCAIVLTHGVHRYLIHWRLGFFIVGPGEGGWEFSALLITSFAAVALDYGPDRPRPVDSFKAMPLGRDPEID